MKLISSSGERGQILVFSALTMVALLGIAALSIDASFMYDKRNKLHQTADGAAKSAAIEIYRQGPTVSNTTLTNFANQQITKHSFGTGVLEYLYHPPNSGPYAGNASYVEVIVREQTPNFFARVLGITSTTPRARAVAGISNSTYCVITLNPGSPSLEIANFILNMPSCAAAVDGNLDTLNPNARISAQGTSVSGPLGCTGRGCGGINWHAAPPATDPLAGKITAPSNSSPCLPNPPGVSTLSPGCYSQIDIGGSTSITLNSGIYYITGPISMGNNSQLNGSNVLIYFTGGGRLSAANNVTLNLTAATSGPYKAILFYMDPSSTNSLEFAQSPALNISGAIYMPSGNIIAHNHMILNNDCNVIVVGSLQFLNGNGTILFDNRCALYGGSPLTAVSLAE